MQHMPASVPKRRTRGCSRNEAPDRGLCPEYLPAIPAARMAEARPSRASVPRTLTTQRFKRTPIIIIIVIIILILSISSIINFIIITTIIIISIVIVIYVFIVIIGSTILLVLFYFMSTCICLVLAVGFQPRFYAYFQDGKVFFFEWVD